MRVWSPVRPLVRIVLIAVVVGLLFLIPSAFGLGLGGTASVDVGVDTKVDTGVSVDDPVGTVEATAGTAIETAGGVAGTTGLGATASGVTAGTLGLGTDGKSGVSGQGDPRTEVREGPGVPAPSATQAASGALAAGAGLGILFWLKNALGFGAVRFLAAPLFSRIHKDDLLDNSGRELLHTLIEADPGISLKELADRSGMGWGTTVYHLGRMEEARLVTSTKHGQARLFFVNGHPAAKSKAAIAVLRNQTAGDVARFLMTTPGANQSTIAKGLGIKAPTVTKYVKRLEQQGLVDVVPDGRTKIVVPTQDLSQAMAHMDFVAAPGPLAKPAHDAVPVPA